MELKLIEQDEWERVTHQLDYTGGSIYRESLPVCEAQAKLTLRDVLREFDKIYSPPLTREARRYERIIESLRKLAE